MWRREYSEDLLNPTDTHSEEEAEPKDLGLFSLITGVEVAGAVKQLRGSSGASGVDEIHPKLLKALDVVASVMVDSGDAILLKVAYVQSP